MDMEYGVWSISMSGIRSRQLKASNNISQGDILDKLEWAFEEGYRLGLDDAK